MQKSDSFGIIYLTISVINGVCIAVLPLRVPSSRAARWKLAVWFAAMLAYFLIPVRTQALGNPYVLFGLATLPLSAGIRLMRGPDRAAGIVVFVAGLATAIRGGWVLTHTGTGTFYFPIPSTSTVIESVILGVIVVIAVTWLTRRSL